MLNWSLGLGDLLGIILGVSGVGLFLLRTLRPTLARDQAIFFAAIAQHQGQFPLMNVLHHERKPL
jgi:Ycf66 protein N-terminus